MKMEKKKHRGWYVFARTVCTPYYKLVYRFEHTNKNSLPSEGGCIICSNHLSYCDPLLIGMGQKREIRFMAKVELFKNKFTSYFLKGLGAFPVVRGNAQETGMATAVEVLKNGEVLGIFAEGTRSKDGKLLRVKSGAALLAAQTQVPILVACITAKNEGPVKAFSKTKVTYGRLLTVEDLKLDGEKPDIRYATRLIAKEMEEIREKDNF